MSSNCEHYVNRKLHVVPKVEKKRVVTIMIFRPNLSAKIESTIKPTTLPMNSADMIEFLT